MCRISIEVIAENHLYICQMRRNLNEWLWRHRYVISFTCIGIVYCCNLFVDIMDIDAAQYAFISQEMLHNDKYLEVYERGKDYLDKPPLLFWLATLSMKIFGVNNFAYKLPAVLIILLGIYSTFKFTLHYYSRKIALYASLILCTTQAFFLMTNDIRTDGILTGFVIFSLWQLSIFLRKGFYQALLLGAVGTAASLMSKGPIGFFIIILAVGGELIMKLQWKKIVDYRWIFFLITIALLLIPMSYGLYTQFDLHPEKTVYGIKSPSGLRFFYWTQSFGRITGESNWSNHTSFFTFFHTILWDFQPWALMMIIMIIAKINRLAKSFRSTILQKKEYFTVFGFTLPFLALSMSNYKLPHYIFPLFPFMAIMVADFIATLPSKKRGQLIANIQIVFIHLFILAPIVAFIFFFSLNNILLPILFAVLFTVFWINFRRIKDLADRLIFLTVIIIFGFGLVTSTYLYPNLLQYQSESQAGKYIATQNIPAHTVYEYNAFTHALGFYAKQQISTFRGEQKYSYPIGIIVFTDTKGKDILLSTHQYKILRTYDDYHITSLTLSFLLKHKRVTTLGKRYLLKKIK